MEELWKDLTISTQSSTAAAAAATQPPLSWLALEEFSASPSEKLSTVTETQSDEQIRITETPFLGDAFRSSSSCACSSRKRAPPSHENNVRDHKHKRLIKNRESAARSRARKQAYTCELEAAVAHLMEENAKLRQQQEKLCGAVLGRQHEKKHKLYRTLTAPF